MQSVKGFVLKKRFQIFFSTLLLLSLSWQCSAKSIIYFNFKYRQNKLVQTLCENKNKPGSCCKAKCYLAKEIKKEEKRQSDLPSSLKDKTEKSELVAGAVSFLSLQNCIIQTIAFYYYQTIPDFCSDPLFHPPTA